MLAQIVTNPYSGAMLAAGIALAAMVLLRRWWRYSANVKRQNQREERKPFQRTRKAAAPGVDPLPLSTAPVDVQRATVELYEVLRDAEGRIDTKLRILQQLLAQSRAEADRLQQLLAEQKALRAK